MGKTSEEGGSEQGFEADGRVYGGRGMVEMVRKARGYQGRREDRSTVLSVRETGTGKKVVFTRII